MGGVEEEKEGKKGEEEKGPWFQPLQISTVKMNALGTESQIIMKV